MILFLITGMFFCSSCSKENNSAIKDEILPKPTNDLVEILIKSLPAKTIYALDEPLDLTGLVIEGKFTDNTTTVINIDKENISGFNSEQATEDLILTVTIGKQTKTFGVKVLPIKVKNGVLIQVSENIKEIELPGFITAIGEKAFIGSPVTKVILNEGITSIGSLAFGWSQISEINFPTSLRHIDEAAFYNCKNLKVLDLSNTSLTKITHESFAYCGITELKLPAGLKDIEYQAFIDSEDLKELTLPEGLLVLGNEAFRGTGLVSLRLPNSVCMMEQRVFYYAGDLEYVETYGAYDPDNKDVEFCIMEASTFEGCSRLKSFAIPRGVKVVGQNTLTKSPDLTSMVLPATIEQINFNAFGNSSLKSVIIEGDVPARALLAGPAWYGFPNDIESVKVPQTTSGTYKAAPGWTEFAKVISE